MKNYNEKITFLPEIHTSINACMSLFIIMIVAAYFGILSCVIPWTHDDMLYQFNFASETAGNPYDRIDTFTEIFESQADHYTNVNGRFIAHFCVQLFCGRLGQIPFAIFNALFYIMFIVMIMKLSGVTINNVSAVATVVILVILSFQTKISPTCQIGYIWMYTIVMAFIWLFFNYGNKNSIIGIILLGVFSLIAGNAHESLNIGISAALILYWIKNRKQMGLAQYVMFISFGVGALSCCLAPGTLNRAAAEGFPTSLFGFAKMLIRFAKYITAVYVLLAIICWQHFHNKKKWCEIYNAGPFYWNALLVLIIFNFCINISGNRQLFGVELMAIILSLRLLKSHSFTKRWLYVLCPVIFIFMGLQAEYSFRYYEYYKEIIRQYQSSSTGDVFIDMDNRSVLTDQRYPLSPIPYFNLIPPEPERKSVGINSYDIDMIRYFTSEFPGHPPIKIFPEVLNGKRNLRLTNQVIEASPGIFVAIQDKTMPSDVNLKVKLILPGTENILLSKKKLDSNYVAVDADYWCAYIYDAHPYSASSLVVKREIEIEPHIK